MESYAVLGATGRVGGHVLQQLLKHDNKALKLYVRSKDKILSAHPELQDNSRVSIYEGDLHDVEVIKRCIADTKACFLAVALSENLPGCSIAMDTAQVVVKALQDLRPQATSATNTNTNSNKATQRLPKLIVLSSSSVSDKFWTKVPRFVHGAIYNANNNIYQDLERAEKFLRDQGDWLSMTFVKPGGMVDDVERGYTLDMENSHTPMSFADLAAAMVEIADTPGDTWDLKDVGIVPKVPGQGASIQFAMPYALAKGLVASYFPSLYMILRNWLP